MIAVSLILIFEVLPVIPTLTTHKLLTTIAYLTVPYHKSNGGFLGQMFVGNEPHYWQSFPWITYQVIEGLSVVRPGTNVIYHFTAVIYEFS
jgi:hypothetical protein